jgi:hypothetical protein
MVTPLTPRSRSSASAAESTAVRTAAPRRPNPVFSAIQPNDIAGALAISVAADYPIARPPAIGFVDPPSQTGRMSGALGNRSTEPGLDGKDSVPKRNTQSLTAGTRWPSLSERALATTEAAELFEQLCARRGAT